jgi:phosphate transport system substrate-binding protein
MGKLFPIMGLAALAVLAACSSDESSAPAPVVDAGSDKVEAGALDAAAEPKPEAAPDVAEEPDTPEEPDAAEDHNHPPPDASHPTPGACNPLDGAPSLTVANFPKLDGSTSTFPLDMILACELFGIPWGWNAVNSEGVAYVTPVPENSDQQAKADFLNTTIVHNKTDPAFVNLINGTKDLIFVASKPSADDLALAASAGVTLDYKSIGLDALVFLLNQANPVPGLTSDQILKIYQGTITDWSQVGGNAGVINPYVRPENSGSQELIKELLFKNNPMPTWPPDYQGIIFGMGGLVDKIAQDSQSIGYTVYYFWLFQYPNVGTKMVEVDGVYPSYDTIKTRTYPYASDVYAIIRTDLDPTSTAYQLREWLFTPKGQCVVSLSGYVPVGMP